MKKRIASLVLFGLIAVCGGLAQAESIYNNIPSTLEHSYYSLAYQATQASQFGDRITFGGTARALESATFTMVDWARQEDYDQTGAVTGFNHAFTLNLYEPGTGYSHGDIIASVTETHFVPYRPTGWDRNGYAFNMTFNLSGITVPNSIVYGLAFNTQTYGSSPIGVNGPYNSLNFGLSTATNGGLTVGTTDLDQVFYQTATANWYTDKGAQGVNIFRMDDLWTGYVPMANFTASAPVPEPGTILLLGVGMLSLAVYGKRRMNKA